MEAYRALLDSIQLETFVLDILMHIPSAPYFYVRCKFSGLEEFGSDKSKCQEHFDVYKECKKKEVLVLFFLMFKSSLLFLENS